MSQSSVSGTDAFVQLRLRPLAGTPFVQISPKPFLPHSGYNRKNITQDVSERIDLDQNYFQILI